MSTASPSHVRWLVVLLLAVVVSRIPLIVTGYSSDPDAWRVANVGKTLWQTGSYAVSRFPGYPLHEIITGPFVVSGGSVLTNSLTLVAALALLLVWHGIVRRETSSPKLLTALLAFTPLFWIDSATTLDYVWSLLFILLSYSAAHQQRMALSGIWLGCAIGFRVPNAIAIVPLLTLLYCRKLPPGRYVVFLLSAIVTTVLALAPVWLTYGLFGWVQQTFLQAGRMHQSFSDRMLFFGYRSMYGLGPFAVVGIALAFFLNRHKLWRSIQEREPPVVASILAVVAFVLLFAAFPLDRSYLLPILPFLYLLVSKVSSKRQLAVIACCILSFAFVNPDCVRHARPVGRVGFNLHSGIVLEELQKREHLLQERKTVAELPINGKAVVMTGTEEAFWFENVNVEIDTSEYWRSFGEQFVHSRLNHDLHFTSGLPLDKVRQLQSGGYALYNLDWTDAFILSRYNYNPREEGLKSITP